MLPLGVRNRLAELILDAFDDPEARLTLEALAAYPGSEDGRVGSAQAARLVSLGWFAAAGPDRVALSGPHRSYEAALCGRAAAAASVFASEPAHPPATSLAGLLARAARLADAGLFFEVHELLEPAWLRADGPARLGLQGLIQVAVGRHHLANGNREGAASLLAEGLAKLAAVRGALPLETADWEGAIGRLLDAVRAGVAAPAAPPWPRPADAAGRRA